MDKIDRRVKRTQKLLQDSMVALTLEKGYDAVTIRDLTDRADVGYTTFFRHYADKEALLAAVLDSMREEFRELLTPHSIFTAPEKTGALLFEYVRENADLCRVLLDSTNTMALLRPVQEIGLQEVDEMFPGDSDRPVPMELAASHMMTSLVMLIRWWLDHDMSYPPEQMGQIAAALIIRPVIQALVTP